MLTANLNKLELTEFTAKNDRSQHCRASFPLIGAMGSKATSMVYFELDEGNNLGRHTDSAEEVLMILEGTVEVTVGHEKGTLSKGEFAVVPTMEPHDLKNIGKGVARVAGIFGANNIVATFDNVWLPTESNTVDTSQMPQPAEAR